MSKNLDPLSKPRNDRYGVRARAIERQSNQRRSQENASTESTRGGVQCHHPRSGDLEY